MMIAFSNLAVILSYIKLRLILRLILSWTLFTSPLIQLSSLA